MPHLLHLHLFLIFFLFFFVFVGVCEGNLDLVVIFWCDDFGGEIWLGCFLVIGWKFLCCNAIIESNT